MIRAVAKFVRSLWLFIAGVISVFVMYYLLLGVEQGIDVLIQAGEVPGRGLFAMVAVAVWAYFLWYSARRLSYIRQDKDDTIYSDELYQKYGLPTYLHRHVPRVLAYNCFVCVQVAIFHLPTIYALSGFWVSVLILAHNGLYVLQDLFYNTTQRNRRKRITGLIFTVIVALYAGFLIYDLVKCGLSLNMEVFDNEPNRHEFWLRLMALFLFGLQLAAVNFFVWRRRSIDSSVQRKQRQAVHSAVQTTDPEVKSWFHHPRFSEAERNHFLVFNISAGVFGLVYLAVIFSIGFASYVGPLAFALLALGVLTGLANVITVGSIRLSFNLFFILYLLAFTFGFILPDPYQVQLEKSGKMLFVDRPTDAIYLERWFDRRIPKLYKNPEEKYPVYIVLSNGGASRAGKWTTSVLSRIQDESTKVNPKDPFSDHLLALAGASGGSVGNCAFYSLLKAQHIKDQQFDSLNFSRYTNRFFASDFLTYTLARFLGPDLIRHLIPVPIDDRAAALENLLSHSEDALVSKYFEKSVDSVFDYSGALPILYITTTQVDNGMPGIISPVRSSESLRSDVLKLVDSMAIKYELGDMKLNTAAVLSSRFPYVSPAGKIFDRYFVDGGYFDNSGAGVVLELIQELARFFEEPKYDSLRNRFSFHIIHVTNGEVVPKPAQDIHPLTNDLLAPVLTLAGMQGSSTSISNGVLKNNFRIFTKVDTSEVFIEYSLYDADFAKKYKGKYEEGYPMSWVISEYQLDRMHRALDTAFFRNRTKLYYEDIPHVP